MYDNLITSDHLEQVVQKIQDTKASKSTTLSGYGITDSYTKTETDNRIQDIVGAAPEALDTLEEIAEALQDGESTAAGLVQTLSQKADKSTTVTNIAYGSKKITKTINGSTTDVVTINAIKSDLALTKSDVGLSNVDNTSDANKPISNATQTALDTKVDKVSGKGLSTNDYTTTEKNKLSGIASNAQVNIIESIKVNNSALPISSKSVNITVPTKTSELTNNSNFAVDSNYVHTDNNYTTAEKQKLASKVAELDNNGKVLSSQLPSYVDDVVEYTSLANFPTTGESGKIYVDTGANLTYRWTGSAYREISPSLALGETSSTAYRGDRGKVAYTHATDSNRLTTAKTSGLYKISTTAEGHVASAETATKSDIGLGNVDNTSDLDKPISTATQEALNTKVNVTTSVLKSDEKFIYRQTGGGSLDIDAKYGKLKSIKGRTLVLNQTCRYNTLSTSVYGVAVTVFNNKISLSGTATSNIGRTGVYLTLPLVNLITGHKYLSVNTVGVQFYVTSQSLSGSLYQGFADTSDIFTFTKSSFSDGLVAPIVSAGTECNYSGYFFIVDLTLMFGAGYEPSTVDEFKELYGLSYIHYEPGKLINNGLSTEYDLVWNQLIANGNFVNGTTGWTQYNSTISASNGELTIVKSLGYTSTGAFARTSITSDTTHKYYMACDAKMLTSGVELYLGFHTVGGTTGGNAMASTVSSSYIRISQVASPISETDTLSVRVGTAASPESSTGKVKNVMLVDLTLMFGAGNEPASPEEFEAMFPADYYAYDTGTQGHYSFPQFKTKIETVGFNQWDEEWEVGAFNTSTGEKNTATNTIRSKNYIPVLPNTTYYASLSPKIASVYYYDSNKSFISFDYNSSGTRTTPANCYYMMFVGASSYGTTYLNDICINLSDPARNGTYEPYWRSELELGLGDIKVKSHNIWDEEWENGEIDPNTGINTGHSYVRSKNYIPCEPGKIYRFYKTTGFANIRVFQYDSNKQFLSVEARSSVVNWDVTTLTNCAYLRFYIWSDTSYANNICINLSDSAFNGHYEPYGDDGIISITGGLKSAGTVYDEISGGKLVKRIEQIDLGSLTYTYTSSSSTFSAAHGLSAFAKPGAKALFPKFMQVNEIKSSTPDDSFAFMSSWTGYNYIHIKDTSYSDAATFKAAMAGVPLYYELAQPIEYELYNPIDLSYKVDKFGTEKLLPGSTSAIVSSPFRADIEYRTTNVTIDDVYGVSDIIKSVEDVDNRLTTVEKSINGLVTIGSGSPTTIPKNIGDFYIDVTNKILYFATGNQLISDWNS